jgi:hypothetical protein
MTGEVETLKRRDTEAMRPSWTQAWIWRWEQRRMGPQFRRKIGTTDTRNGASSVGLGACTRGSGPA